MKPSKSTTGKSYTEWFQELPQPVSAKALACLSPERAGLRLAEDLPEALKSGFVWDLTIEEAKYWAEIYDKIKTP